MMHNQSVFTKNPNDGADECSRPYSALDDNSGRNFEDVDTYHLVEW